LYDSCFAPGLFSTFLGIPYGMSFAFSLRKEAIYVSSNIEDKRAVKLEKVLAKDFIPLFSGRPSRERVIGREDLMDLDILLHTSSTLEEFLAKI
jgi:hypothetical protein